MADAEPEIKAIDVDFRLIRELSTDETGEDGVTKVMSPDCMLFGTPTQFSTKIGCIIGFCCCFCCKCDNVLRFEKNEVF